MVQLHVLLGCRPLYGATPLILEGSNHTSPATVSLDRTDSRRVEPYDIHTRFSIPKESLGVAPLTRFRLCQRFFGETVCVLHFVFFFFLH